MANFPGKNLEMQRCIQFSMVFSNFLQFLDFYCSTMNPEKNYPKMTDRMANLFQSFQYGTNAYQSGQYDACQPLRNKCFELHARTN